MIAYHGCTATVPTCTYIRVYASALYREFRISVAFRVAKITSYSSMGKAIDVFARKIRSLLPRGAPKGAFARIISLTIRPYPYL